MLARTSRALLPAVFNSISTTSNRTLAEAKDNAVPESEPSEKEKCTPPEAGVGPDGKEERRRFAYSPENLDELKFHAWPYKIERDWDTTGKRMTFWADWRMAKDVQQREITKEWAKNRLRWKVMKTNNVLPQAIINEFQEKMDSMPKYAHPNLIRNLCIFTGRNHGKIKQFRLNRHTFREMADSGRLSGVQRALW